MALSWQGQEDCPLHFPLSVLRSKRSALDLMQSQFSKLSPLPEVPKPMLAHACVQLCTESQNVELFYVSNIGIILMS